MGKKTFFLDEDCNCAKILMSKLAVLVRSMRICSRKKTVEVAVELLCHLLALCHRRPRKKLVHQCKKRVRRVHLLEDQNKSRSVLVVVPAMPQANASVLKGTRVRLASTRDMTSC
ncbi:unnamed protein product [Amoebophrya sp. A25]|nr:unnamed protein product [Amoebophrya sp. A25]|eukprot:GSA25T00011181001.1